MIEGRGMEEIVMEREKSLVNKIPDFVMSLIYVSYACFIKNKNI